MTYKRNGRCRDSRCLQLFDYIKKKKKKKKKKTTQHQHTVTVCIQSLVQIQSLTTMLV